MRLFDLRIRDRLRGRAGAREIITGNPWASKDEVLQAVTERHPKLKALLVPHAEEHWHHISDAIAVSVAHLEDEQTSLTNS